MDYELARQYMSKADGEEERILGHTQLGEIFYKDCQYDSALYYFEKDFSRNHYTMLHCGNRIARKQLRKILFNDGNRTDRKIIVGINRGTDHIQLPAAFTAPLSDSAPASLP